MHFEGILSITKAPAALHDEQCVNPPVTGQ